MEKKLYRDEHRKIIGGVCAGLADYFNIDVTIVRVIFVVLLFSKGAAFIPYIILLIVLPKRTGLPFTDPNYRPGVDYRVPPQQPFGQPFTYPPVPPVKKSSGAAMVFGIILIALGSLFLLDQFEFIPDLDFDKLWPVILVVVGGVRILTGKKEPWEKHKWDTTPANEEPLANNTEEKRSAFDLTKKSDEQANDNPTTL